jgi:hypothetical protein
MISKALARLRPPKKRLRCSFCRKDDRTVAKLLGGPKVYICDACVGLCNHILADESAPGLSGWTSLTDAKLLEALPSSNAAVELARETLQAQVNLLREREVSWAAIGEALAVSRQAAWERFS